MLLVVVLMIGFVLCSACRLVLMSFVLWCFVGIVPFFVVMSSTNVFLLLLFAWCVLNGCCFRVVVILP